MSRGCSGRSVGGSSGGGGQLATSFCVAAPGPVAAWEGASSTLRHNGQLPAQPLASTRDPCLICTRISLSQPGRYIRLLQLSRRRPRAHTNLHIAQLRSLWFARCKLKTFFTPTGSRRSESGPTRNNGRR